VDLLDYLAGPELEGLQHEEPVFVCSEPVEDPTARAVQVLKSIAEDQSALLESSSTSNLPTISQAASPAAIVETTNTDFLDLFPEVLDESVVDSALDPDSILAPMSPEDIDNILSSGPCSPESVPVSYSPICVEDSGFASSLSSVLDESTEVQVPCETASIEGVGIGADILQLLHQVQANQPVSPPPQVPEAHQPLASYTPVSSPEPMPVTSYRSKPYERPRKPGTNKGLPKEVIQLERKLRKKQQNKDAATRYRQKKKLEKTEINGECEILESRNAVLHEKVDSMTKEIRYLKDLLAEVFAAKGLTLPKSAR